MRCSCSPCQSLRAAIISHWRAEPTSTPTKLTLQEWRSFADSVCEIDFLCCGLDYSSDSSPPAPGAAGTVAQPRRGKMLGHGETVMTVRYALELVGSMKSLVIQGRIAKGHQGLFKILDVET
jgi:hypothetical protein